MSVHYKFKSALEYDTVTFDGLHISVKDLKKAIIHQKRIGKNTDFDLQVTNAQTKEVYNDENTLIPKNTSLVIARVPMAAQIKGKQWEGYGSITGPPGVGTGRSEEGNLCKATDLTQLDASEDDKIRAMMTQSTLDYDPSNYMKIRGSNQVGAVPPHYRCYKCHQPGHWIKDCPLGHGQESMEIKKSTGIPRSFMVPVEGPMVPGAMMTPTGQYAVPALDHQAYNEGPKPSAPAQEEKPEIPEDLVCTICKDLLTDAVMIPCCGNSFCDECIRTVLLESEDHECPDCHEKEISPGTLIPNRFLRNSVSNFKNETGYHKRQQYRNAVLQQNQAVVQEPAQNEVKNVQEPVVHPAESTTETRSLTPPLNDQIKKDSEVSEELERSQDSQKPIISEADSTETAKSSTPKEDQLNEKVGKELIEGPPGVESPIRENLISADVPPGVDSSPNPVVRQKQGQAITSVGSAVNHHRVSHHASHGSSNSRSSSSHTDRHYHSSHSASYTEHSSRVVEERPGTPTVDEPGNGPSGFSNTDPPYSDTTPPGLHPTTTTLPPPQHMHPPPNIQGPPPSHGSIAATVGSYSIPSAGTQPPSGNYPTAPPPTGFRLPPPGHPDFNRVGLGTGYGDTAHILPRALLVTSLDPSIPPPNIAPPPGTFPPRPVFDPTRPPFDLLRPPVHGAPPPGYPTYPPGGRPSGRSFPPPRHIQPPPPGMAHRPPPHSVAIAIDDPLEAFNRMLREKDERDRRARDRDRRRLSRSRSYSRSRSTSRSYSRSPRSRSRSPPPRVRHRSRTRSPPPRTRRTPRSRSRSFSISRSRSFSRSPSFRGSPVREYSPRRRPPSRFRSPMNRVTPPRYRYNKENRPSLPDRDRDRERDRDRDRLDRDRLDRDRLDRNDRNERDRDYQFYDGPPQGPGPMDYDNYNNYDRSRPRPPMMRNSRYGGPNMPRKEYPMNDPYYQPPDMCPPANYPPHANRYNIRGPYPPPLLGVKTVPPPHLPVERDLPPHRKYDDIAPPGIDQPPVPGFENQRYDNRYQYDRSRDDGPPGVDRFPKTSPFRERDDHEQHPPRGPRIENRDYRDRPPLRDNSTDNKFDKKFSPSPDRRQHKSISPKRASRDRASSIDKSRRRSRRDESNEREKRNTDSRVESDRDKKEKDKDKDKKRDKEKDNSEDEKSRKSRDKKKKKEKKEADRKKRKEKKEKKEQEKLKKAEEKKSKDSHHSHTPKKDDDNNTKTTKEEKVEPKSGTPESKSTKVEKQLFTKEEKEKVELYDDILSEGIDNAVVENYGKISQESKEDIQSQNEFKKSHTEAINKETEEDEEKDLSFDGIELQANEAELKTDFVESRSKPNEVLAPLPGPSKWEIEEDTPATPDKIQSSDSKTESKHIFERPGKIVTSEVIKRAENAIFAKAINAIRPIEIKKISLDRAKLYSGEKEKQPRSTTSEEKTIPESNGNKEAVKSIQITIPGSGWDLEDIPPPGTEPIKLKTDKSITVSPPPNRLSVKERLGCKVEELDRITKEDKPFEKNRSKTLSPLSRRTEEGTRNVSLAERRVEVDDRRRDDYRRRYEYDRDRRYKNDRSNSRDMKSNLYKDRRSDRRRDDKRDERRERSRSRHRSDKKHKDEKEEKHREEKDHERKQSKTRRSKTRSESKDRKDKDKKRKIKDRKHKREKEKEKEKSNRKHRKEDEYASSEVIVESKIMTDNKRNSVEIIQKEKIEKPKLVEDRRKPTLDEANFEPDYDLETESEKEENFKPKLLEPLIKKRDRSISTEKKILEIVAKKRKTEELLKQLKQSSSSDSSSESSDEKHKKKHKKHKKKKSKKDTSSSSDSSDTDSSVEKKSKKRHKSSKKMKKKKKSKHK